MTFEARIADIAQAVEATMADEISACGGPSAPKRLMEAMCEAVFGGGKRFRPFLVVECAGLFGISEELSLRTAAAVEFIHCYSLVHDDLPAMDNDAVRRGKASIWAQFDEWTAILVGDGLQALAFQVLASRSCHANGAVRAELARELAVAAGAPGMVGGQALDLAAEKLGDPAQPSIDDIRRLQMMKTGALIRCACEAGAILGEADEAQRHSLRTYGAQLGSAFQIADDLLDVEGDTEVVGKTLLKDDQAGKATLLSLMGLEAARAELVESEQRAIEALSVFGARADTLREAARFAARRNQ